MVPMPTLPRRVDRDPETAPDVARAPAPVETYLAGQLRLPPRLKAPTLMVEFASNLEAPAFECAEGSDREFLACPDGGRHDFGRLVHGRTYQLKVRALDAASGRGDTT